MANLSFLSVHIIACFILLRNYKHLSFVFKQEEQLSEHVKKLEKEKENLEKEKQSLEELNSTWSQKIVEQKEEIESMKNTQIEMEASIEETRKKLDVKNNEVETLEEKLKTEVGIFTKVHLKKIGMFHSFEKAEVPFIKDGL